MERIIEKIAPIAKRDMALKAKRVAAYARVSDGKDTMIHSLSAQVSHYSQLIQRPPGWSYAGCFARVRSRRSGNW